MPNVNISALSVGLKERREHYSDIFGLALDNGFGLQGDFVVWPVDEKYEIKRKVLGNITQPGKTGAINNAPAFLVLKSREGKLQPGKVDMGFGEVEIDDLNDTFMQEFGSSTPLDIYSLAGQDFIVDNVFMQIGHEVSGSIYGGEKGSVPLGAPAGAFQGGLNLIDGLGAKFDDAITAGDILASQVITKAVAVTSSNVLAELKKIIDKVWANDDIRREMKSPSFASQNYSIFLPTEWEGFVVDALEALPYKEASVVRYDGENYIPSKLKRTVLKFRNFMDTPGDEAFFTPNNNIFFLPKKGAEGNTARSASSFEAEKKDRNLQFLIDWKYEVDFADPRTLILYK